MININSKSGWDRLTILSLISFGLINGAWDLAPVSHWYLMRLLSDVLIETQEYPCGDLLTLGGNFWKIY